MSNTAILVDHLSKKYGLGKAYRPHDTLQDSIGAAFNSSFHKLSSLFGRNGIQSSESSSTSVLWALKEVSFDVKQGEVIGIIGRNGAGKSTLLKILSRITHPTGGYFEIRGRVGSLLEVGTGFHHELTGRDNIFLSAAILGMKKHEITRRFDAIVDFAGVEKFIDTPVKHYSSGMYMRLGFAVAAHLEAEILIVDEVLAVGDAEFQSKCLGKIGDVAKQGRTVLFVSHNMNAVRNLCSRAILMMGGQIQLSGPTGDIVQEYLAPLFEEQTNGTRLADRKDRFGSGNVQVVSFEARASSSHQTSPRIGVAAEFIVGYRARHVQPLSTLTVGITVADSYGTSLLAFSTAMKNCNFRNAAPRGKLVCEIEYLPLIPGTYWIDVSLKDSHGQADYISRAAKLTVIDGGDSGFTHLPGPQWGLVVIPHKWSLIADNTSATGFTLGFTKSL